LLSSSFWEWPRPRVPYRCGLPNGEILGFTFRAGLENHLQQNPSGRLSAMLAPVAPGVALEGALPFKPDLGQYDPSLKGLLPYFGGGLSAVVGPSLPAGVSFC